MKERAQILNEFGLKLLAILFMTLDHIGLFLISYFPATDSAQYTTGWVFRALGRIAFPLFAFMLAEGMNKTKNPIRYLFRISLVWAVSLVGEILLTQFLNATFEPDPLTDLLMDGLFVYAISRKGWKKLFALLPLAYIGLSYGVGLYENFNGLITILWFPRYLRAGYNVYGLLVTLGFYFSYKIASFLAKKSLAPLGEDAESQYTSFLDSKSYRGLVNLVEMAFLFLFTLLFWGLHYANIHLDTYNDYAFGSYGLLAMIFLYLYNGKRGPDSKAFRIITYSYFPVHLAIIFFVFRLILGH
ncbi:MAG: TraX protein [Tenericutes bacterium ADurb.BinA155]|jgi:hypothetical protein|nr:MAG: TraX protein [Tenericutes bacterium ADurb.BinA155]